MIRFVKKILILNLNTFFKLWLKNSLGQPSKIRQHLVFSDMRHSKIKMRTILLKHYSLFLVNVLTKKKHPPFPFPSFVKELTLRVSYKRIVGISSFSVKPFIHDVNRIECSLL